MLPNLSVWSVNCRQDHLPSIANVPLRQSGSHSIRGMNSGDPVCKLGAATGYTSGIYHRFKQECWLKHDKHMGMTPSSEFVFMPHRKPPEPGMRYLASHGDSGAAVFDRSGHVIGLLLTGQTPENANNPGPAVITPIEDVLADIKISSGEQITDIRILPR